jgi:oligo-1,6-glucosidase
MPFAPETAPWWTRATVYQVYPRSFADANGDGVGDLRGVLEHLDHLEALGVEAVWLSPVYPSPMRDNGYDVADYQGVDPLFGTLADLDALIAALHARGMKLILDVVLNHTSDAHPWFQAARRATDDPLRDWYWWRAPRAGFRGGEPGAEPTNWRGYFGGPAWTYDARTDAYYLHLFDTSQPDLNWEHPPVREALFAMLRWWLARGVDGFRMDVINLVSKELPLRDGPVTGPDGLGDGYAYVQSGPRIHEFVQELHRQVLGSAGKVLLTVGEMVGVTPEQAVAFTDPERREVDMVFTFEHVSLDQGPGGKFDLRPLPLPLLKGTLARWQEALAARGWNSLYLSNHDQPRSVSRFGDGRPAWRARSAKALATVLHLHRGTPFVYQGEELGMPNHPFPNLDAFRDVESTNYVRFARTIGLNDDEILRRLNAKSRDHARTPVPWTAAPDGGFGSAAPWLPHHPDHADFAADAQRADPSSVFHHYRRLIALRRDLPVVALGDFRLLAPDHERLWAFERRLRGDALLVVANCSSADLALAGTGVAIPDEAELLLGTLRPEDAPGDRAKLRGWEARVYRVRSAAR